MGLEPGKTFSHYLLVEKLGEGGMGVVWKALDTRLERHVALKVLSADMASVPERLKRFEREAKAVAALNHANIVTLYSVEEAEGVPFITMEVVDGRTLEDIIPAGGLPVEQFLEYAVPLADALGAAHERGIVHRDLKPTNIMVGKEGRLRILDFGLAKLRDAGGVESPAGAANLSTMTQAGQLMGTVPYMSPEQLRGEELDHRSDVFSLGIILCEMSTGARPFGGVSSAEVISSILRDAPAITKAKTDFPDHVGVIVRRCLEKDPARRYQSAKDLRADLESLRREIGSDRHRQRRMPWGKTSLRVALLAAAGILLFAAVAFLFRASPPVDAAHNAVAVLPFANLTGDASRDYLGEGISAGLITQLSEVSGIHVTGRSAAWNRKDPQVDLGELAKRLGVGSFLEGEVQRAGDQLKVDVKLTDADSGLVLWSEDFEGQGDDLFSLQKEIAHRLATVLSVPLSRKEFSRLARDPTRSLKAYEYFLRGTQHLVDIVEPRSLDSAIDLFRQALRLDPRFALAHCGLSEALWRAYWRDKASEKLAEAEREARRALEIDPDLPAAQVAVARVLRSTGRYAESIDELRKVLANHPKPDEALRELAMSYEQVGNLEEAEKCWRAAAALGSKDWSNWNCLGDFLHKLGKYDEAREAFQTSAELAPKTVSIPRENMATMTFLQGRFDEAIDGFEGLPKPIRRANTASNLATAYYFSNRPDKWTKADEYYRLAVRLDPTSPTIRRNLADLYVDLGRRDDALQNYREALRLIEEQLRNDPKDLAMRLDQAQYAAKSEQCEKAVSVALGLSPELPQTASNAHDIAYVYALCDREREALEAIGTAVRLGFSRAIIRQESEFKKLKDNRRFLELTDASSTGHVPGG